MHPEMSIKKTASCTIWATMLPLVAPNALRTPISLVRSRTTMAVHINWFGVLPEWGLPLTNVQAAAAMCDGLVKYRAALHAGTIPVESMRGNPLDMHQFLRVFGMTRVPQEGADVLQQVDDSRHVVVLRRWVASPGPPLMSA